MAMIGSSENCAITVRTASRRSSGRTRNSVTGGGLIRGALAVQWAEEERSIELSRLFVGRTR